MLFYAEQVYWDFHAGGATRSPFASDLFRCFLPDAELGSTDSKQTLNGLFLCFYFVCLRS